AVALAPALARGFRGADCGPARRQCRLRLRELRAAAAALSALDSRHEHRPASPQLEPAGARRLLDLIDGSGRRPEGYEPASRRRAHGLTTTSFAGRPPSGGTSAMSHVTAWPSRMARMNAARTCGAATCSPAA